MPGPSPTSPAAPETARAIRVVATLIFASVIAPIVIGSGTRTLLRTSTRPWSSRSRSAARGVSAEASNWPRKRATMSAAFWVVKFRTSNGRNSARTKLLSCTETR